MGFGYDMHTLTTVPFIGGATQEFGFPIYRSEKTKPFSLYRCKAWFSVKNALNKTGLAILSKEMGVAIGTEGVDNVLTVTIEPLESVNLNGKYEYQITVIDQVDGRSEIAGKGYLYIDRNIDAICITG